MHDKGFAPGDRLALLARNCWQYAVLAFATARAGVILVPVNFMLTAEEVGFILGHSKVSGFIVQDEFLTTAEEAIRSAARDAPSGRQPRSPTTLPTG